MEDRLHRSEVVAAVEQMGATVAHNLRGPLGQVVQAVNMIKQDPSLTPRMLQIIEENSVRSLKMIADWRSSTREIVPQPTKTSLRDLVRSVLEGLPVPINVDAHTSIGDDLDSLLIDQMIMHSAGQLGEELGRGDAERWEAGGQRGEGD